VTTILALNRYSIDSYAAKRLEPWAQWALARAGDSEGLRSMMGRLSFCLRTPGRSIPLLAANEDDMLDIQELVNRLPDHLREMVVSEWLYVGTPDLKARQHKIAVRTYQNRLTMAYYHLIEWGL